VTARRLALAALPAWPRFLTREQAAAYVGVSPALFDLEVATGIWPAARERGQKGGLLTWDRVGLDMRADQDLPSRSSTVIDDFEARRRHAELSRREQGHAASRGR
jgi:hypothetical protein